MELLTIRTRVLNSYCFGISHPVKSTHDVSRVNKIQSHARLKANPDALRYELAEWVCRLKNAFVWFIPQVLTTT